MEFNLFAVAANFLEEERGVASIESAKRNLEIFILYEFRDAFSEPERKRSSTVFNEYIE